MGVRMKELRKIATQFLSHNDMTQEDFVLLVIAEILLHRKDRGAVQYLAETLLNMAQSGGDGW